jgi:pro-apoptotic serine protease NMA111
MSEDTWTATIERVIPAIVSIRFMTVRTFDTHSAGTASATGFVVDRTEGIILTNR